MPGQCPECGVALRGMNELQLEQHIDQKQSIICGDCGESSSAKEWRDGKTHRTAAKHDEKKDEKSSKSLDQEKYPTPKSLDQEKERKVAAEADKPFMRDQEIGRGSTQPQNVGGSNPSTHPDPGGPAGHFVNRTNK